MNISQTAIDICSAFAKGHQLGLISRDVADPAMKANSLYATTIERECFHLGVAAGYERATGNCGRSLARSLAEEVCLTAPGEVLTQRAVDFNLKQVEGDPVGALRAANIALANAGHLHQMVGDNFIVNDVPHAIADMAKEITYLKAWLNILLASVKEKKKRITLSPEHAHEALFNAWRVLDKAGVPDTTHNGVDNPYAIAQCIEQLVDERDQALAAKRGLLDVSANAADAS
ncbi:MAG: hypothetical protein Q8O14_07630 [bacterium]|nr:hypothetical protein [bacterium]